MGKKFCGKNPQQGNTVDQSVLQSLHIFDYAAAEEVIS